MAACKISSSGAFGGECDSRSSISRAMNERMPAAISESSAAVTAGAPASPSRATLASCGARSWYLAKVAVISLASWALIGREKIVRKMTSSATKFISASSAISAPGARALSLAIKSVTVADISGYILRTRICASAGSSIRRCRRQTASLLMKMPSPSKGSSAAIIRSLFGKASTLTASTFLISLGSLISTRSRPTPRRRIAVRW